MRRRRRNDSRRRMSGIGRWKGLGTREVYRDDPAPVGGGEEGRGAGDVEMRAVVEEVSSASLSYSIDSRAFSDIKRSLSLCSLRQSRRVQAEEALGTVRLSTPSRQIHISSPTSLTSPPSTQPSRSLNPVTRHMEPHVPPTTLHRHQRVQLLPLAPSPSPFFGNQPPHSQVSSPPSSQVDTELLRLGRWFRRRTKRTMGSPARRRSRRGRFRLNGRSSLGWSRPLDCWRRERRLWRKMEEGRGRLARF